jgi:hypothetical protein
LFWRWGLCTRLASNLNTPNFSLPSSQDYRCEALAPGLIILINTEKHVKTGYNKTQRTTRAKALSDSTLSDERLETSVQDRGLLSTVLEVPARVSEQEKKK